MKFGPYLIPVGEPFVIELPAHRALTPDGRDVLQCMECDHVMTVQHECGEGCGPHPEVREPIPMRLLPHWAHR